METSVFGDNSSITDFLETFLGGMETGGVGPRTGEAVVP